MTITLTPNQEKAIQDAIQAGLVRSVDEFIDTAIEALPRRAGARIRELRRGVRLERGGMSIRELAHIGHKY